MKTLHDGKKKGKVERQVSSLQTGATSFYEFHQKIIIIMITKKKILAR